jgi:hypothetical protein
MTNFLDINNYINDGFQKLCDVENGDNRAGKVYHGKFYYTNINKELMFSDHRSWVYMIVSDNEIVKIGETGNPLGIRKKNYCSQPKWSTECRMGRLAAWNCNTDGRIRESLYNDCDDGKVSIWVRKCDYIDLTYNINGRSHNLYSTFHKDLELAYLDYIFDNCGSYPILNVGRK